MVGNGIEFRAERSPSLLKAGPDFARSLLLSFVIFNEKATEASSSMSSTLKCKLLYLW